MADLKTTLDLADEAAKAIRALHGITRQSQSDPDWQHPGDAWAVVGSLRELSQHLPQLYGQIGAFVQQLATEGHLRSEDGGDGAADVVAALAALQRAQGGAETMAGALDTTHSALSHLLWKANPR
ncbi:hypothetical protein [Streptomyces sp. NPDC058674]|uniref:hypothetical protein n=1 Tax=Streptomyces sp. NPDC058674 TaxID=3346592 RepID=UPI003652C6D5